MGAGFIGAIEKDAGGGESEVDVRDFGGDAVNMEGMYLYDVLLEGGLTYKDEEAERKSDGLGPHQYKDKSKKVLAWQATNGHF
eukprot:15346658-Ditylum_brightwellii.AAC.1